MKGFFNGLVFGIILGAVGYWFVQKRAAEHPEAQQRYEDAAAQFRTNASAAVENTSDALRAKLDTLDLHADQIKDELAKTGEVIRRKAHDIGETTVDAASDARAVTEIKAKYAGDSTLSVWKISVSCDHGHVVLSGTVSSPDDIGKAVALALDAGGVRDVTSTLQVKPNQ
ncbi:MAG TPA: BON domain-containing protein [Candidatus Dormibacteraeota bacterium]|nr:BON domain-containing protein [Candidatus Dormibacteraeota bacterium]